MLIASQISVEREELPLFEPVSFQIKPGQLIHLRGENGKGKTTLLKVLLGLCEPTAGKVSFSHPTYQSLQSASGYIGHKLGLKGELTVAENLTFISVGCKKLKPMAKALEDVGLKFLSDALVTSLSQGQKKRASLARFFYIDKALWLLDEPFNAVDCKFQKILAKSFEVFLKNGGMLVLTSHQTLPMSKDFVHELILK